MQSTKQRIERLALGCLAVLGVAGVGLATPDLASAQGATRAELVASARSAASRGAYEDAVRGYSQARASGGSGLDVELALASWQAGQDGFALDVLAQSREDEAPLLAHAMRADLDPALVLTLRPDTRRDLIAQLAIAQAELDASQGLVWASALAATGTMLAFLWPTGACQGACDDVRLHTAGALGLVSLSTLAAGLTLAIAGRVTRAGAASPLRADARGVSLVF